MNRSKPTVAAPIIEAVNVTKEYDLPGRGRRRVRAVRGVSLAVEAGCTVGVVGESGCGKSTLARVLVGLERPTTGEIHLRGEPLSSISRRARQNRLRAVQMVFQSPFTALDPRMSVHQIIREPLEVGRPKRSREDKDRQVETLMEQVGLPRHVASRKPAQLSGGQQQRVGLARAVIAGAELVVCDEPVSALDVSVQAQVINLLREMQDATGVSYIFIAHNLSVVATISDYIAVMYLGNIVEYGSVQEVFETPLHPYTQALISSSPDPDSDVSSSEKRIVLRGELPSPSEMTTGCPFRSRCWKAGDVCAEINPLLEENRGSKHSVACHFPDE